jgi:hypothetical protein
MPRYNVTVVQERAYQATVVAKSLDMARYKAEALAIENDDANWASTDTQAPVVELIQEEKN